MDTIVQGYNLDTQCIAAYAPPNESLQLTCTDASSTSTLHLVMVPVGSEDYARAAAWASRKGLLSE